MHDATSSEAGGLRNRAIRVGLIGDYDADVIAHQAIPIALSLAAFALDVDVLLEWIATDEITSDARVAAYDALWCVPASPYRSTDGALRAIRYAREHGVPFLGTCGGFQHAILEYARNVIGWADASHAELTPGEGRVVIAPLECSLVEVASAVRFTPGSRIAASYGALQSVEGYHCRYGLDASVRDALTRGPLFVSAEDDNGDVRAVELDGHPFFVATLFQPERAALDGRVPPIVAALVSAASVLNPNRRAPEP